MASFSFSWPLPILRVDSSQCEVLAFCNNFRLGGARLKKCCVLAFPKKKPLVDEQDSFFKQSSENSPNNDRRTSRSRKMINKERYADMIVSIEEKEKVQEEASVEASKKTTSRVRKKASTSLSSEEGNAEGKVTKRRIRRKAVVSEDQNMETRVSDADEIMTSVSSAGDNNDEYMTQLNDKEEEDTSFTYSWPPLVCCFGAAQHFFIPSGRLANRMIDHEIHESKKDMFWTPTKLVRAPGGSPSSVAIAHASIGGRVAFIGKLGDDEYGRTILYHLNVHKVQTRAIKIDCSRPTAVSQMKISKRHGLKASCLKPCAEDSFLDSEINIDVLKEVS